MRRLLAVETGAVSDDAIQATRMGDLIGLAQTLAELIENPATFTPSVDERFTLDREAKLAMSHKARRIAFRLLLRQPRLEVEYLVLKLRYTVLRVRRYLLRRFAKDFFRVHF